MQDVMKKNVFRWCALIAMVCCLAAQSQGVVFSDNFNNTQLDTYYGEAGGYGVNQELAARQGGSAAPLQWEFFQADEDAGTWRVNEFAYPGQLTSQGFGRDGSANPAVGVSALTGLNDFTMEIDVATITQTYPNWFSVHVMGGLDPASYTDGALSANNGLMLIVVPDPSVHVWYLYCEGASILLDSNNTVAWPDDTHLTISVSDNRSKISAWVNDVAIFTDVAVPAGGNDGDQILLSQYAGELVGFDNLVVVPEPATMTLLMAGLGLLRLRHRKQ